MRSFDKEFTTRGAALVTGASRGLGFALANELKRHRYTLIISGRDAEALKKSAEKLGEGTRVYTADLSVPGEAERLYQRIKDDGINLSVLVNNAGIGGSGELWSVPDKTDKDMIEINVRSAVVLTKLFLSDACARGYGSLLNVCSVAAFQPGPYMASYYASKAYLHSYTTAARYEAKKYGVNGSSLCPGPLDTDFFRNAGANTPIGAMSAEKAAEYAVNKFLKGKKTIVPGFYNRAARLLPQSLKTAFVASIKRQDKNK